MAPLSRLVAAPAYRTLLFLLIPNIAMLIFNRIVSGSRPGWIDIDYAAVPIAATFLNVRRWVLFGLVVTICLTALVLGTDLLSTLTEIYFAGPAMLLDYLPFLSLWPWRWIGAMMLEVFTAAAGLVLGLLQTTSRPASVLATLALTILGLFAADRMAQRLSWSQMPLPNIVSSATIEVLRPSIAQLVNEWRNETTELRPTTVPTMASIIAADPHPPARILSVAVESWGRLRDKRMDAAMTAPLLAGLRDHYTLVENGLRPFYGATLAGEVRELCSLKQIGGVPHGSDQYQQLRRCLPAQLARQGYRTIALHGNAGSFYRRIRFYPMMGFAKHWHYEQMRSQVPSVCSYLFVGICDRDAARIAVAALDSAPRTFVHLMTLDTHLPLPPATGSCLKAPQPDLCTYQHGIAHTLGAVAEAVRTGRNRPDMIVLYGDHAPPFVDRNLRRRFAGRQVPFMILRRTS